MTNDSSGMVLRTVLVLAPVITMLLMAGLYAQHNDPCSEPVTYRIASVDDRFGMNSREVAAAVKHAASLWEDAAGCTLFREDPQGVLEIHLVYDHRQATSDRLRGMNARMESTRESYDALKAHFERIDSEYRQQMEDFTRETHAYNARVAAFNASLAEGCSREKYAQMEQEQTALAKLSGELQARSEDLRLTANTLKGMVSVLDEMAANLNIEVESFNRTGRELGDEFSEGCYERANGRQSITIYHFTGRTRLVRVLAHELGHALGFKHVDNPSAIMHHLNVSDSLALAPEDVAALKTLTGRD